MNAELVLFLTALVATIAALGIVAMLLTLTPRMSRALSDAFGRPPLLDMAIALLTWAPWLAAGLIWGWLGVAAALAGQVVVLYGWIFAHELMHREAMKGPRLVKVHHRLVGPLRNQLSLMLTVVAVPVLWAVRLLQIVAYPLLVWLLDFPRYRQGEWVNLTRHKFRDLVGHDLVWCLYCDWMTGVWSLGSEMLRNVESFWCPIRFGDEKKNAHARTDFPDVAGEWVPADGTMAEAAALVEAKYGGGRRSWFGHPERDAIVEDVDEDAHRETLADHSTSPRNCRALDTATHHAAGHTPICNDRVEVFLQLQDGRIADITFTASACALCTASASLMTQQLKGREIEEARRLHEAFHVATLRPNGADEQLGDLAALGGIHRFPSRIKCALLPWHTMNAALNCE